MTRKTFALIVMSLACVLMLQAGGDTEATEPNDDPEGPAATSREDNEIARQRLWSELYEPIQLRFPEPSAILADFFASATPASTQDYVRAKQLLQYAARYASDPDIIRVLVESGFDPNEGFGRGIPAYPQDLGPEQHEGPLHDAARWNPNPSIVEALIEGGADVQAVGGWELERPLHYAAANNNAVVVSALIEHGADVDAVNGRISAYYIRSANINANTALHSAAFNDDASVIEVLVNAGADPHTRNSSGMTPLHFAVLGKRPASISALVQRGADPNAVVTLVEKEEQMHDCTGCNPVHVL